MVSSHTAPLTRRAPPRWRSACPSRNVARARPTASHGHGLLAPKAMWDNAAHGADHERAQGAHRGHPPQREGPRDADDAGIQNGQVAGRRCAGAHPAGGSRSGLGVGIESEATAPQEARTVRSARRVRLTLLPVDAEFMEPALLQFVDDLAVIAADLHAEGVFLLGTPKPAVA